MARVVFFALLLAFAGAAHADVIDVDEEACLDAARGDRCNEGRGTCEPDTCCHLDYSQGTPPTEVCSDCLTCQRRHDGDDGCDAGANGPLGLGALGLGLALLIGLRRTRR